MTYFNNEPGTRQQRATPRGWRMPIITGALGIAVGGVLAGTITAASVDPEIQTETQTVTETVEVESTPDACIEALDLADTGLTLTASSMSLAMDGWEAYINDDVPGVEAATAGIDTNNQEMEQIIDPYHRAKAECGGY